MARQRADQLVSVCVCPRPQNEHHMKLFTPPDQVGWAHGVAGVDELNQRDIDLAAIEHLADVGG